MNKTNFALSAASLFLAAACGGSAPAESTTPATTTPAASEGGGATDMYQARHMDATTGQVKCVGVNECKGQGACHMPNGHACAGQNECKGKGWISVPAADCSANGGTVLAE